MNYKSNIISSKSKNSLSLINEIFSFKDLLYFMIKKEISVLYKQTVLGFSWAIIRPLFSMVIFTIIFGNLAKISSDGVPYPVFSYAALLPWTFFSNALNKSTYSLINSTAIITKVYFPRLILPLAPIIAGLVDFFIAFSILIILMIYYGIFPDMKILWLPFLLLIMILSS